MYIQGTRVNFVEAGGVSGKDVQFSLCPHCGSCSVVVPLYSIARISISRSISDMCVACWWRALPHGPRPKTVRLPLSDIHIYIYIHTYVYIRRHIFSWQVNHQWTCSGKYIVLWESGGHSEHFLLHSFDSDYLRIWTLDRAH